MGDELDDDSPFAMNTRTLASLGIIVLVGAVASASGVGGGAIFIPLLNALVGFNLKSSTSLSQACITCGAAASLVANLMHHHPSDPRVALVDFTLAAVLTPILLMGSGIGVLLNVMFPSWLLTGLLLLLLALLITQSVFKGRALWLQENALRNRQHHLQQPDAQQQQQPAQGPTAQYDLPAGDRQGGGTQRRRRRQGPGGGGWAVDGDDSASALREPLLVGGDSPPPCLTPAPTAVWNLADVGVDVDVGRSDEVGEGSDRGLAAGEVEVVAGEVTTTTAIAWRREWGPAVHLPYVAPVGSVEPAEEGGGGDGGGMMASAVVVAAVANVRYVPAGAPNASGGGGGGGGTTCTEEQPDCLMPQPPPPQPTHGSTGWAPTAVPKSPFCRQGASRSRDGADAAAAATAAAVPVAIASAVESVSVARLPGPAADRTTAAVAAAPEGPLAGGVPAVATPSSLPPAASAAFAEALAAALAAAAASTPGTTWSSSWVAAATSLFALAAPSWRAFNELGDVDVDEEEVEEEEEAGRDRRRHQSDQEPDVEAGPGSGTRRLQRDGHSRAPAPLLQSVAVVEPGAGSGAVAGEGEGGRGRGGPGGCSPCRGSNRGGSPEPLLPGGLRGLPSQQQQQQQQLGSSGRSSTHGRRRPHPHLHPHASGSSGSRAALSRMGGGGGGAAVAAAALAASQGQGEQVEATHSVGGGTGCAKDRNGGGGGGVVSVPPLDTPERREGSRPPALSSPPPPPPQGPVSAPTPGGGESQQLPSTAVGRSVYDTSCDGLHGRVGGAACHGNGEAEAEALLQPLLSKPLGQRTVLRVVERGLIADDRSAAESREAGGGGADIGAATAAGGFGGNRVIPVTTAVAASPRAPQPRCRGSPGFAGGPLGGISAALRRVPLPPLLALAVSWGVFFGLQWLRSRVALCSPLWWGLAAGQALGMAGLSVGALLVAAAPPPQPPPVVAAAAAGYISSSSRATPFQSSASAAAVVVAMSATPGGGAGAVAASCERERDGDCQRQQLALVLRAPAVVLAATCAAGLAGGLLGLGGGMVIGPLLLHLGVQPQVTAATSGAMVLFSSSSALTQFALMGRLNVRYAAVFGAASAAASLAGSQLLGRAVRRSGRPSLVVLALAGVMAAGAACVGVFGVRAAVQEMQRGGGKGPGGLAALCGW